ncbi:MAG: hypothetical protein QXH37_04990, partial [Candidatus Bathyarchaeia archaeon]
TKAETDIVPFLFSIPDVEGARFIKIRNSDGDILAERAITMNSPVVNIDFPNGGESLNIGGNYTISWNAYDPDGDELSYLVSYSKNGGGNMDPSCQQPQNNKLYLGHIQPNLWRQIFN